MLNIFNGKNYRCVLKAYSGSHKLTKFKDYQFCVWFIVDIFIQDHSFKVLLFTCSCQKVFLNNMGVIGQNIAHNMALRENVMMMVVCINLRIPLFLIGKPGSSKSLAKTVVNDSLKRIAPSNEFLKDFKEVTLCVNNLS